MRLAGLVQFVKNTAERAAYDKDPEKAFPPRHILWSSPDEVDKWFKDRKDHDKGSS